MLLRTHFHVVRDLVRIALARFLAGAPPDHDPAQITKTTAAKISTTILATCCINLPSIHDNLPFLHLINEIFRFLFHFFCKKVNCHGQYETIVCRHVIRYGILLCLKFISQFKAARACCSTVH